VVRRQQADNNGGNVGHVVGGPGNGSCSCPAAGAHAEHVERRHASVPLMGTRVAQN
jgi:hypothetical protein